MEDPEKTESIPNEEPVIVEKKEEDIEPSQNQSEDIAPPAEPTVAAGTAEPEPEAPAVTTEPKTDREAIKEDDKAKNKPEKPVKKHIPAKEKSTKPISKPKKITAIKEPKIKTADEIVDPLTRVSPPSPEPDSPKNALPEFIDYFPHRHYPSIHPCCNRLLEMRWDIALRKKQVKRLAAVKPTVDFNPPKPYKHLQMKLKKIQMQQDRQREIHRNNKILLERMSNIMFLEAHNPEIHETRLTRICKNKGIRERMQMKISLENQKLVQRLETQQPLYNHSKLLDDRLKNLQYLQNISSFPQKYIDEQKGQFALKPSKKREATHHEKNMQLRAIFTESKKEKAKKLVLPEIRPKTVDPRKDRIKLTDELVL